MLYTTTRALFFSSAVLSTQPHTTRIFVLLLQTHPFPFTFNYIFYTHVKQDQTSDFFCSYFRHAIVRLPLKHLQPLVPTYAADLLNGTHIHHSQVRLLFETYTSDTVCRIINHYTKMHFRVHCSYKFLFLFRFSSYVCLATTAVQNDTYEN